jgi:hypothetical protein
MFNALFGIETFLEGTATKDYLCNAQADEVPRCFKTEARVCACYNDGLAREGVGGVGQSLELGREEPCQEGGGAALWLASV